MFKLIIIGFFALHCYADGGKIGYGSGYSLLGLGDGLGGGLSGGLSGSGGGLALGIGGGGGVNNVGGGRINAAILSSRSIQVVPVASNAGASAPTVVDIDSDDLPVVLNFNSRSSSLLPTQQHYGQAGTVQHSSSLDEPHRLVHQVSRPVVQDVREVIVPFRNIQQVIRPVVENINTIVARGEGRNIGQGAGLGGGQVVRIGGGIGVSLSSGQISGIVGGIESGKSSGLSLSGGSGGGYAKIWGGLGRGYEGIGGGYGKISKN